MKSLDTLLFGATLVVVPMLAWAVGRCMGRRDWRIGAVLCASVLVAALPHLARVGVLAALGQTPFFETVAGRVIYGGMDHAEISLFFLALAAFVTMIGWTSTPVTVRS